MKQHSYVTEIIDHNVYLLELPYRAASLDDPSNNELKQNKLAFELTKSENTYI
jgi:hypothetical protein